MDMTAVIKRLDEFKAMGLSVGNPTHDDFSLYIRVYDRLLEFIERLVFHNIPFMIGGGDGYRTLWVMVEHADILSEVVNSVVDSDTLLSPPASKLV